MSKQKLTHLKIPMHLKAMALTGLMAALMLASSAAQAHPPGRGGWHGGGWHGGGGVGFYFGAPYPYFPYAYSPYAYPYPYAYSPPPVIVTQPQPQVYIEQGSGATSAPAPAQSAPPAATAGNNGQAYWYYCEQSDSYYPYVKECPAGWKQVTPSPPTK
ncbi:hypothetical protein [Methylophilus sp. OH31]|uniref:hypothetical protein n=1 Tax=Methylophilus sp. OH31 TaxID=1387312 RepID=UPI0004B66175|nr:hypothetical protein [Methylophilus sp. OH31]